MDNKNFETLLYNACVLLVEQGMSEEEIATKIGADEQFINTLLKEN